jgi:hypothetical protein
LLFPASVNAEPIRLQNQLKNTHWLDLAGSYRLRYETLANTFRVVGGASDQLLASRLLVSARVTSQRLFVGFELQDSRAWWHDRHTPIGTDDINVTEPLQAYVGAHGASWLTEDDTWMLRMGRMTLDIGSRRLIARNGFRNTINAFTGIHGTWQSARDSSIDAFYTLPVSRLPNNTDRSALRNNEFELDRESSDLRFWGVHAVFPASEDDQILALYMLGIAETDQRDIPSRNRSFVTAGIRLGQRVGAWHLEMEAAYQHGRSRATILPGDRDDLDHRAYLIHLQGSIELPRLCCRNGSVARAMLRYDYASGDKDPTDGRNERFDTLYGGRRFELGPTGLYGPFARSNIHSLGIALVLKPNKRSEIMLQYRPAWLASQRDAFVGSGLRDFSGQSGHFAGHQAEVRWRWHVLPGNLLFELGGAYLAKGEFLREAPGAPDSANTVYGYAQIGFRF